jgi:CRP/FNR family transcriptional regulator, cyclic AMP receptor protein
VLEPADSDRRVVGIRVLEAQPDLAEELDEEQRALARRHLVAVLEDVEPGRWEPDEDFAHGPGAFGLLVIDGVLARDLAISGRSCSELLGPGDLLRPWDQDDAEGASVQSSSGWTVLEPTRFAILDDRFARVACRWPPLVAKLMGRTLRRSRWLAILLAISNLTRVDERVVGLMWHLADRWGHVTAEGVVVPVALTHDLIGRLVGAHRPSVTSALGELQRAGVLERRESGGWLLHGPPPVGLSAEGETNGGARAGITIDPGLFAAIQAIAAGMLA